jgi:Na+/melibiose symporter-like transporter
MEGEREGQEGAPLLSSFYDEADSFVVGRTKGAAAAAATRAEVQVAKWKGGEEDDDEEEGKLGWHLIASYGLGHVLNDLSASIWFFYAVVYSQQVLGLSEKLTGGIILIGQTVDGLTTPVVGYSSDHTKSFLGRRKPWYLFGVLCVVLTFPLVFGGCLFGASPDNALSALCLLKPWHHTKTFIGLYVLFISIFQVGWASSQVSHLALMPDISQSKKHRTTLSSVRYGVTVTCNIAVLLALWVLLEAHQTGKGKGGGCNASLQREDQSSFQILSWSVTLIGILCATGFTLGIPNHPTNEAHVDDTAENVSRLDLDSLQETLVKWNFFHDPLFWKHGLLYMLSRLMINLNMVYMPLYVQSTMRMPKSSIAVIPLLMYIFSLVGSLVQNKLNHKFGRAVAFIIGVLLQTVGSLSLLFLPRQYSWVLYVIAPTIGLAGTSMLVTVISMTSDFIGNKSSMSAKVFGLYSFTDKLCSGVAVYAIQSAITCGDCCVNTKCCGRFYRHVLGVVPLGAAILSLAILVLWKQMKQRKMKREQSAAALLDPLSYAEKKSYGTPH